MNQVNTCLCFLSREMRPVKALALGVDLLKMSLPLRGRAIIRGINPSARALTGLISLETKHTHLLTYNRSIQRDIVAPQLKQLYTFVGRHPPMQNNVSMNAPTFLLSHIILIQYMLYAYGTLFCYSMQELCSPKYYYTKQYLYPFCWQS